MKDEEAVYYKEIPNSPMAMHNDMKGLYLAIGNLHAYQIAETRKVLRVTALILGYPILREIVIFLCTLPWPKIFTYLTVGTAPVGI